MSNRDPGPPPTKSEVIKLRVSWADVRAWQVAARTDQMALSDWIRRRCNGLPTTAPVPFKGKTPLQDAAVAAKVAREKENAQILDKRRKER